VLPESPRLGGSISHIVAYPTRDSARIAARRIPNGQTVVRERTDPNQWVLEISHPVADATEIEARAQEIEAIARATGGEYEGWESTMLSSAPVKDGN
jgi:hypothetical protein